MLPGVSTAFVLILSVGFVEDPDGTLDSTDSFHHSSYAECIDILYTTNTICIRTNDFILYQLPRVLLPQRLASITSVKINWMVSPFAWEFDPFEWEHSIYGPIAFNSFLRDLPITLPHLIRLHISLEGRMDVLPIELYDQVPRITESHLMVPIDGMVRKLGPNIRKCYIALPASVYTLVNYHTENATEQAFPQLRADWARIWRELPASDSTSLHRSNNLKGYWVRIGQLDLPSDIMLSRGIYVAQEVSDHNLAYRDD